MNKIDRPDLNDAPAWYEYFFNLASGDDLIAALEKSKQDTVDLINFVPGSLENYKYGENKWTIKQVFIHLIDEERYYAYKAVCYSRQMDVFLEIPMGESYTKDFNADNRTLKDVCEEYTAVRNATICLFRTMTKEMLDFKDFPGETVYSARSLGWFTVGHNQHHLNLIKEKYLN